MNEKIFNALNHHFLTNRVVFWYDDGGKMRDEYKEYNELGIEKAEIENNEFYIRYLVQNLEPEKRFLVYSESAKPADEKNWLLDINLSNFVFASDEASMYLQELDLDERFMPFIRKYVAYFRNKKERLIPLKAVINPSADTEEDLILAMISVFSGSLKIFADAVVNIFIDYFVSGSRVMWENICKYKLDYDFWIFAEKEFSYRDDNPSPEGLLNWILKNAFDFQLKRNTAALHQHIFSIVENWRNNLKYSSSFKKLLDLQEKDLNIAHELSADVPFEALVEADLYKETDRQLFSKLLEGFESSIINLSTALHILEKRRETYWYKSGDEDRLKYHYQALYHYLKFMDISSRTELDFKTLDAGWKSYVSELYQLDKEYRKFIYFYQQCGGSAERFKNLLEKIEGEYTEGFTRRLADAWQLCLDSEKSLKNIAAEKASDFFARQVAPYLEQDLYLFVIISDGLRYESGAELADLLEQQNRFRVELSSMAAPVPTYTQLGMAALLPHDGLAISDDGETVFAGGKSTRGLENREKVLQSYLDENYPGKKARTLNALNFYEMPLSDQEDFIKGIDLIYLYTAGIDSIGDSVKTEKPLPSAVNDEIKFISELARKIVNLNRTHLLVTADHGFLYRYRPLPETEWVKIETHPGEVKKDHRFIMAADPAEHPCADIVESDELEWKASFKLQTARGVTLIRRAGGGSRYVHGGRMIQELCVPLLALKKSRTDDVSNVQISVIDRKSDITTGQIGIKFLQETPADNKTQAREIIAVFEGDKGVELSNSKKLIFDSGNPNDQNRSRIETFIFNKLSDSYNGRLIYLKLYDIKSGNTKVFYKEYSYRFRKRIQSDFDF